MDFDLQRLTKPNKKLEKAIVELKKQASIHTPTAYYLDRDCMNAAINAACHDAKKEKIEVSLSFNGTPVRVLEL